MQSAHIVGLFRLVCFIIFVLPCKYCSFIEYATNLNAYFVNSTHTKLVRSTISIKYVKMCVFLGVCVCA